jgi:putative sigma-54 modulation protein
MNLNIHPVHFTADEKLIILVKEKCEKLNHFNENIVSIDVYLKLENNSQQVKDKTVEIKLNVLHSQIFVKSTTKTFEESFSNALNSSISVLKKKKGIIKG